MSNQFLAMLVLNQKTALRKVVPALERAIRVETKRLEDALFEFGENTHQVSVCRENLTEFQSALDAAQKAVAE